MALECSPIWNLFSTRCILLLNVTSITGLDFCFTYLDNIWIYSTSWKEHLQHLETVISHLQIANLKTKLSKCQLFNFNSKHIHFLWHLISGQGIQPLPHKILAITNLGVPKNISELYYFLSLNGYYKKFIPLTLWNPITNYVKGH